MSRKTLTAKAVVVAGAVAATSLFAGGTASAATATVTKAGPAKTATTTAATIAIAGKDFDSTILGVVFQNASEYTCVASSVVVVSSTLLYATKPASGCVAGVQKVELHNVAAPTDATTQVGTDFAPAAAASTVTFVAPVAASGVSVTTGLTAGGTALTVTHGSVTYPSGKLTATIGGVNLPVKRLSATTFSTVTPPNKPGALDIVITANGVAGPAYNGFTYKQGLKVTPNVGGLTGAVELKITGIGFKPTTASTVAVTVCGVAGTVVTTPAAKVRTDRQLYVTAPTATAASKTTGGACDVVVSVDDDGAGANAAVDSVITKDSTFTYVAY